MSFVLSSLSEGLLWSIMAIGVYLTFRILDIADMTAEGAFPLGAAVVVSQIQAGTNPWIATLLALLAGMVAGLYISYYAETPPSASITIIFVVVFLLVSLLKRFIK